MRGREGGSVGGAPGAGVHTPQRNAHGTGSDMSAEACTQQECAGRRRIAHHALHSLVVVHRTKREETAVRGGERDRNMSVSIPVSPNLAYSSRKKNTPRRKEKRKIRKKQRYIIC